MYCKITVWCVHRFAVHQNECLASVLQQQYTSIVYVDYSTSSIQSSFYANDSWSILLSERETLLTLAQNEEHSEACNGRYNNTADRQNNGQIKVEGPFVFSFWLVKIIW